MKKYVIREIREGLPDRYHFIDPIAGTNQAWHASMDSPEFATHYTDRSKAEAEARAENEISAKYKDGVRYEVTEYKPSRKKGGGA